jgi:4-amino-4-deoxy-L-arabinose transferase-like glycosyltransferase
LILYLPGIAALPIIDRDSSHFAQATRQMIETGNYWQVNFQDQPRHLKPPGIYWLQALSVKVFSNGHTDAVWPYRLPGIIGALLAVLFTFVCARTIYDEKTALLGAALLAASFLLIIETHLMVTDAVLLLTMVVMQGSLWRIYSGVGNQEKIAWYWVALFWLAMTAGVFIKGITPLIAGLTILSLVVIDRQYRWLSKLKPAFGIAILLGVSAVWLIPFSVAANSNFLMDMIHGDLLPKVLGGQQSHGMPPGYFLFIFPLMFWPGSLFFGYGCYYGIQKKCQPSERFLLTWIIPIWILFELIPTKLPEYVLPIYPAVALLCARGIIAAGISPKANEKISRWWFYWLPTYNVIWLLYSLVFAGFILFIPYYIEHQWQPWAFFSAIIICISAIVAVFLTWQKKMLMAVNVLILAVILSVPPLFQIVLPTLSNLWLSEKVAFMIQKTNSNILTKQHPLFSIGYGEPSLVFILGTNKVQYASLPQLSDALVNNKPGLILVAEPFLTLVEDILLQSQSHWRQIKVIKGFNYSDGKWMKLSLIQIN